ncbi:hypothetical protein, partial [Klebsiella pneumoniae]|uniref:hypothetical protein n=1 Tax=Klebsiella pneumoniae TaxID=573 RepID=UPI001E42D503
SDKMVKLDGYKNLLTIRLRFSNTKRKNTHCQRRGKEDPFLFQLQKVYRGHRKLFGRYSSDGHFSCDS